MPDPAKVNPSDQLAQQGKRSIDIPWLALIRRADGDFDKDRRRQPEYEFAGGRIRKDAPTLPGRGAYTPLP